MKLSVNKDNFLKALQKVTNIIGSKSTLPVLANILIEAEGKNITLTTTDLELRITTKIEAEIEREGKTTIRAKKLLALVSKFIGDKISMDCNEKHHTEIKCGTSKFTLLGLSADDFPLPVEFQGLRKLKLRQAEIGKMFDQISYAVSLDDSRKVLHGILCSIKDNNFTSVATDGKRLALVEKIVDSYDGPDGDAIIPLKSANEIKRLMEKEGDVLIQFGEKQASFETANILVTTKLIDGNYPNYRQVIPVSFTKKIEIPTQQFLYKLDIVATALSETNSFMKINFEKNKLVFEASSNEIGEGNDYIDVVYEGETVTISFNPDFIADPFKHSDADKVVVKLNDGYNPVAVEGGNGFLYVIMPMRNK